jgi:uncharacterized iron-regulated membrane protein
VTRMWFRIHSFTGVITGLLLFVVCWSGAFATVSYELDWLVTPEARTEPSGQGANWGAILTAVQRAHPDAEVVSMHAPVYARSAAEVVVNLTTQKDVRVYVDPYRGRVQGARSSLNVGRFFRSFHRDLFFPTKWGLQLVAALAVTMMISLIAALNFYRRWWTRFFHFRGRRGRPFWSDLHKVAGLWSVWFVIVIGVTGIWYGFERLRFDLGDGVIAYVGTTAAVHPVPAPHADAALVPQPLEALLTAARAARPDIDIRTIRPGNDMLYVDGQVGDWLVRDRANQLYVNTRTGAVLYNQNAADLSLYWRWSETADPLHFGDFGGLASKAIWLVFGLVLSGLILTGSWLHVQRLAREASALRARWPGTMAACFVSLGVLLATAPFGIAEARENYGPAVDGVEQLPSLAPGVTAVITVWVAVTLAIIATWIYALWRPQRPRREWYGAR